MCGGVKIKSLRSNIISVSSNQGQESTLNQSGSQAVSSDPSLISCCFNQTFSFIIPTAFLDDTSVVVSLCVRGRMSLKQDAVIGRVISGPITFACGDRITHWGRMLADSSRYSIKKIS